MNITLTSLEALILKATNETLPCPDPAAVEAFCAVMRDSPEGPQLAAQALAARIHVSNAREALLGLCMLDRCMRRGDANFQAEVGKFRFLNEMIKLVSPKYFADRAAPEVKTREERRSEASSRRAAETAAALDSAGLLRDMLAHAAHASADELQLIHELHGSCLRLRPALQRLAAGDAQGDSLEDILHASDVLDEVVKSYDAFVSGNKDATTTPAATNGASLLDLAAGDRSRGEGGAGGAMHELGDIFAAAAIAEPLKPVSLMAQDDTDLLCDNRGEKAEGWHELDSLGEQLLRQSLPEHARRPDGFTSKSTKKIPMNALEKSSPKNEARQTNDALLDLDFFTKKPESCSVNGQNIPSAGPAGTSEDELPGGSQSAYCLWVANVKDKVKAEHASYTMNEVEKLCGQTWHEMGASEKSVWEQKCASGQDQGPSELTSPAPTAPRPSMASMPGTASMEAANGSPVDTMLDISMPGETPSAGDLHRQHTDSAPAESRPLSDINVSVSSVTPSLSAPVTLLSDGVTVALHACTDRPRADVGVFVVTAANKRPAQIDDYKLSAVVPKPPLGCKVRLLPASATTLPPHNPFASETITQVMLVSRPTPHAAVPLKLAITYVCDDDMHSAVKELTLPAETLP